MDAPAGAAPRRLRGALGLEPQQRRLALEAAGVAGQRAVAADDAVARHDDRDRVAADRGADGAARRRPAELARDRRRSCASCRRRCAAAPARRRAGTRVPCRSSGRRRRRARRRSSASSWRAAAREQRVVGDVRRVDRGRDGASGLRTRRRRGRVACARAAAGRAAWRSRRLRGAVRAGWRRWR